MFHEIWLVIECGGEIMPTNNVTKFDDDPSKNIQVTERTRFTLVILANSRTITPKSFIGSGWLSNLAEIFCQQTFSQSIHARQHKLMSKTTHQIYVFWRQSMSELPTHISEQFPFDITNVFDS